MCPAIVTGIVTGWARAGQLVAIFFPVPSNGPFVKVYWSSSLIVLKVATTHHMVHSR